MGVILAAVGCLGLGASLGQVPAGCDAAGRAAPADPNGTSPLTLERILARTEAAAKAVRCLKSELVYDFVQPLYESRTTRKGWVAYRRGAGHSDLRIHFATKKEDETPEVRYAEDLFFDGVWRTHIDYAGRMAQKHQMAPADEPIDALELVNRNVPIFGFSGMASLRGAYRVDLVSATEPIQLRFEPDPNGTAEAEYRRIDVWLDPRLWLPVRVEAESPEEEVFSLRFPGLRINESLDPNAFVVRIPEAFGEPEVVPLDP